MTSPIPDEDNTIGVFLEDSTGWQISSKIGEHHAYLAHNTRNIMPGYSKPEHGTVHKQQPRGTCSEAYWQGAEEEHGNTNKAEDPKLDRRALHNQRRDGESLRNSGGDGQRLYLGHGLRSSSAQASNMHHKASHARPVNGSGRAESHTRVPPRANLESRSIWRTRGTITAHSGVN